MTIEEAINELTQCYNLNFKTAEKKNEAISMAIEALKRQQWISVAERLPEIDEGVLVSDGKSVRKDWRYLDKEWYFSPIFKDTVWMPMPPLPTLHKEGE